jgi:hypothetical protein
MASKVKAERFDKANKSKIKDGHKRTRTGAFKTKCRTRSHSNHHKH